jgi:hypothetical protein
MFICLYDRVALPKVPIANYCKLMVILCCLRLQIMGMAYFFREYFHGLWGDRNTANFDEQIYY